jgi:hypothetical protein
MNIVHCTGFYNFSLQTQIKLCMKLGAECMTHLYSIGFFLFIFYWLSIKTLMTNNFKLLILIDDNKQPD